jgi:sterol desaturase/sphingolipid hydroxylase (fatty acid hydroxylase superfamily)
MNETLLLHEGPIRLAVFAGVFAVVALWELAAPRRRLSASKAVRWASNLGLVVVDTLLLRLTFPILAVGLAALAQQEGWGLLNRPALQGWLPGWLAFALAVLALDFAIYLQHVMFHAVPTLWRLHRMHHTDLDFDVTTGTRFHPIEILLSMAIKLAAVGVLGPPPAAVVVFEVLLNGTAMFNHGNIRLPLGLDRWLRLLVVTPDMHRVHHSIHPGETNSNFGFNLPWWDRLFGTYRAQPRDGHEGMTIGIEQFRDPGELWLHRLLLQPFRSHARGYSITRWGGEA